MVSRRGRPRDRFFSSSSSSALSEVLLRFRAAAGVSFFSVVLRGLGAFFGRHGASSNNGAVVSSGGGIGCIDMVEEEACRVVICFSSTR